MKWNKKMTMEDIKAYSNGNYDYRELRKTLGLPYSNAYIDFLESCEWPGKEADRQLLLKDFAC